MPASNDTQAYFSGLVAIGKDLVALLRDAMLLLLAVLLIGWPGTINGILTEAGFEEGSFAGLKWKAKLEQSDETLVKAQSVIADLKEQNDQLNQALSAAKSQLSDGAAKANITRLEQLNTQVVASSSSAQASVEAAIAANAPLVQKIQAAAGTSTTWGVVYGGDRDIAAARYEVQTIARKLDLGGAAIYYRQGSYRSVATATDRVQAEQLLDRAKQRRQDAYIVNLSTWCKNPVEKDGYTACTE